MKIGILSDTHNNREVTKRAVLQISRFDPEVVIHCGDLESPEMLDLFAGLPMKMVYGNCDWDQEGIRSRASALGLEHGGTSLELTLAGRRIIVHHGDNPTFLSHALNSGNFDYLFHGHTHLASDEQEGGTRVINPGALYRADPYTFAILDLASGELQHLEVK